MFSRKEQLVQRTGKSGVGRYDYLKQLVNEFQISKSKEARTQILANLANFAYDPINYEYFRQLRVIDLFVNLLSEDDTDFVRFAIAGICNLCLDPENKEYIIHNQGVRVISSLLSSSDEETVLSTITTLMFLVTPESKAQITNSDIVGCLIKFADSPNNRLKNLALVFLNDYCSPDEVQLVKSKISATSITISKNEDR